MSTGTTLGDALTPEAELTVRLSELVYLPALLGYRHLGRQMSAADPDAPSVLDKMLQATNGVSATSLPNEPYSKQVARQIIGWGLMLFAPANAVLFGVLIGTSLPTGAFRSGQNHARHRYVDNLGLVPLRTQQQRQIERQARLFSQQRHSALITGEDPSAMPVRAVTVGTGVFIYFDASAAFLSAL